MGTISDALENKLLDHVLKNTAFVVPTNIYIALSTTTPVDAGTGVTEPVGLGYARIASNVWNVAASRATANTNAITWAMATGSWGTITHFALYDAVTGGNFLAHGAFTASKIINNGDTASIAIGDLDVSVTTGGMSNYLANKLLDHVFKTTAFVQPTNLYCALVITASITDIMTGTTITEPAVGGYARKLENTTWGAGAAGLSDNAGAITFVTATGAAWGTVIDFALVDAVTAGNLLFYGTLDASKAIDNGDTAEFPIGDWNITLD